MIDDHVDCRELVAQVLATAGFEVLPEPPGGHVLGTTRRLRPHLLVLDLGYPGGERREVVRRLKLRSATRQIPILALTADASQAAIDHAFAVGCDDVLVKPYRVQDLAARARRLVGPTTPVAGHGDGLARTPRGAGTAVG